MKSANIKVKARMVERSVTQEDLVRVLGRSMTYVNLRMNNKASWTLEEVKALAAQLKMEPPELASLFLQDA